jgi:hypothetical protein
MSLTANAAIAKIEAEKVGVVTLRLDYRPV